MSRRRTIDDWRRAVYASQSPDMTSAVKVLCLFLADRASKPDLYISVPRDEIAKALGVHKARIAERLKRACEAGFLHSVSRGHIGHTAVYRATFPDVAIVRPCVQQSGTQMETVPSDASRHAERYPFDLAAEREPTTRGNRSTGRHNYNAPVSATADRNVSRDEHEACRWHGHEQCPSDCADHPTNRQESA